MPRPSAAFTKLHQNRTANTYTSIYLDLHYIYCPSWLCKYASYAYAFFAHTIIIKTCLCQEVTGEH